jgi:hypothetical protein
MNAALLSQIQSRKRNSGEQPSPAMNAALLSQIQSRKRNSGEQPSPAMNAALLSQIQSRKRNSGEQPSPAMNAALLSQIQSRKRNSGEQPSPANTPVQVTRPLQPGREAAEAKKLEEQRMRESGLGMPVSNFHILLAPDGQISRILTRPAFEIGKNTRQVATPVPSSVKRATFCPNIMQVIERADDPDNVGKNVTVPINFRGWALHIGMILARLRELQSAQRGGAQDAVMMKRVDQIAFAKKALEGFDNEECKELIQNIENITVQVPQDIEAKTNAVVRNRPDCDALSKCELFELVKRFIRHLGGELDDAALRDDFVLSELSDLGLENLFFNRPRVLVLRLKCQLEKLDCKDCKKTSYDDYEKIETINIEDTTKYTWTSWPALIMASTAWNNFVLPNEDSTVKRLNITLPDESSMALFDTVNRKFWLPELNELISLSKKFTALSEKLEHDIAKTSVSYVKIGETVPLELTTNEYRLLRQWWLPDTRVDKRNRMPAITKALDAFQKKYQRKRDGINYEQLPIVAYPKCDPKKDVARLQTFLALLRPFARRDERVASAPTKAMHRPPPRPWRSWT